MNYFNHFTFSPLITAIATFILGVFVLFKGRFRKSLYIIFALYSFNISWWSLCATKFTPDFQDPYLIWGRLLHLGAILIPAFFIHFVLEFLEEKNQKIILPCYLIAGIFLGFNFFTRLFIKGITNKTFYSYPTPSIIYPFYFAFFAICVLFGLYKLFKASLLTTGTRRNQIRYLLWSSLFGYIGGFKNFMILVGLEIFPIYPYGTYAIPIYVLVVTIAIIKHHLMDIKLARQYLAMNLFYGAVASAIFIALAFFLRQWFWGISVIIFLAILLCPYLHRRMTKFLEPAFLGETFRAWNGLDRLKESNPGYISEQIAWNLVGGISETLHLDQISLFLEVAGYKELRPYAQLGLDEEIGTEQIPWVTLKPDSALVKHLSETKRLVIKDELADADSNKLKQEMKRLRAEISVPLFVQDELIGILNLGPKPDQEIYHQEELKKIIDLCRQAENHLSHARFMENRATFSRQLAHDMKNLVVKNIEPTFAELCETKDEKKRQELLNTVFSQYQYLKICLKNNFDLVSLVERLAYHKYILEPAQIAKVIMICASLYKTPCAKLGIGIALDLPKNLPAVLLNLEDIPKVFNNLFDNALKFTSTGGKVSIKAEQKDGKVLITFSDTGRGISNEWLKTIFEPKLKMPDDETQEGTGLGLVIVRDIIEAHKGSIRVESEKDKGTTFYISLCIAKETEEA